MSGAAGCSRSTPSAERIPCNDLCGWASTPADQCTGCLCGGRNHGSFRVIRPEVLAAWAALTAVDPFVRLPVAPSDTPW